MSLIPDVESCYAVGLKHGKNNQAPMPENAQWKSAYMSGWHKGRKVKDVKSDMPYRSQYVLEEVIKMLESMV